MKGLLESIFKKRYKIPLYTYAQKTKPLARMATFLEATLLNSAAKRRFCFTINTNRFLYSPRNLARSDVIGFLAAILDASGILDLEGTVS